MQLTFFPQKIQDRLRAIHAMYKGYWRVLVVIVLSLVMLGGTIAMTDTAAVSQVMNCSSDESMLVYPLYDRRGNITDTRSICSAPHRGCTRRSEGSKVYDCSPFMAPEDLLVGNGFIYN